MSNDDPFAAAHARDLLLDAGARRESLAQLSEGLGAREPFVLVTGDSGTGKTALVQEAVARWGSRAAVAFVTNPALTRTELLEEIARRFGVEPPAGASKPQVLACLERVLDETAASEQVAVIVVDDAHELPTESLEELRLLSNLAGKPRAFEIVLAGLTTLESRLSVEEMAPLRQRVGIHCRLDSLSQKETRRYLHEVVDAAGGNGSSLFTRETCREIYRRTRGVPRAINALAAEVIRRAKKAKAHTATVKHVQMAAETVWAGAPSGRGAAAETRTEPAKPATPAARATGDPPAERAPAGAAPVAGEPDAAEPVDAAEAATPAQSRAAQREPEKPREPEAVETAARSTDETDAAAVAAPDPREDSPARPSSAAALAPTPEPPASNDPRVRDWVGRFIGDEEPRFGELLKAGVKRMTDSMSALPDEAQLPSAKAEDGATTASPAPDGAERRGARRPPVWAAPLAIVLLALTALVALIVIPRARQLLSSAEQPQMASAPEPAEQEQATPQETPQGANAEAETSSEPTSPPAPPAPPAPSPEASASPSSTPLRVPSAESKPPPELSVPALSAPGWTAPSGESAPPAPPERFTLRIGTYASVEQAVAERDRLAATTGLPAWVVTSPPDSLDFHTVVLGIYSTVERAETSAHLLFERDMVTQALIIPLPPRSKRH